MPSEARIFLESLFARKPDELYGLLCITIEKDPHWFAATEEAIRCAELMQEYDLFVGVGLASRDYGYTLPCLSDEIAGIVGVWADLDLRSDAHPKATLPRTIEQALSILPPEMPPSLVLSTGNGIQVWWLFREPNIFENDDQRRQATDLVNRWNTLLRDNASQRGWTHERRVDLARLLRVPGTTNCKDPSNPKPVVIHSQSDCRYNPSELTKYLDDLSIPDLEDGTRPAWEQSERFQGTPLTINLLARIPDERLNRWLEADLRFKNTWFRQRHDLHDQSQDSYDLALACFGLNAGCTDQEVLDLIVHHRSLHKQKQRTRLDYFERTFSKAHRSSGRKPVGEARAGPDASADAPPGPATEPQNEHEATGQDQDRVKIGLCHEISAALGVEVLRIVKLTGKDPLYRLELAEGKIEFPSVGKLISQAAVREAIAGRAGVLIHRIKSKEWERLAQMLLSACIEEEGGEELQYEGAARLYIDQYLIEATFISSAEGQIAQDFRKPMVRSGRITICSTDLQMNINKTTLQNLSVRAVVAMLCAIGAKMIRVRGKKIKEQSRWELPLNDFDPADYSVPEPEEPGDQHE